MERVISLWAVILCAACVARGENCAEDSSSYGAHIAAAHAHYRLGEYDEARRWLREAPVAFRGWEYDYLAGVLDTCVASVASGHGSLSSVDVSADGRLILTAATDGGVDVRSAASFEVLRAVGDHTLQAYSARFSPDGRMIATVSRDQRAVVWDAASGEMMSGFDLPNQALADIAFSPDSSLVAVCSWRMTEKDPPVRGFVRIWDPRSGGVVRETEAGVKPLSGIAFTPDGERVVVSSWDGLVHVVGVRDHSEVRDIALPDDGLCNAATCIAVSPDGALAAAGSRDSTVRIVDLAKETVVATLRGAKLDVLGVAFSRDGSRLACSGADGAVRVWRTNDWTPAATLVGHTGHVRGVRFTNDGSSLVTAGYDGTIRRWDAARNAGNTVHARHASAGVYSAVFSADGRTVTGSCFDGSVHIWDADTGETAEQWTAHPGSTCHTLCYSADGSRLVTGSWDQSVKVWSMPDRRVLHSYQHPAGVYDCAITADGGVVAAGLTDGSVWLWWNDESHEPVCLAAHAGQVMRVAFSRSGELLATAGADGAVNLWSIPDGQRVAELAGHRGNVLGLAFSRDDALLASCGGDGKAMLWNVASAELVRVLMNTDEALRRCSFSPDGSRLAIAGETLHVVDVVRGGSLLTLRPHLDAPYDVSFSPDGNGIASCSTDGSIAIIYTVGDQGHE
ncbi:MAG: WD40 repeat domain-containing protein [Phycisphaerales bacterium]